MSQESVKMFRRGMVEHGGELVARTSSDVGRREMSVEKQRSLRKKHRKMVVWQVETGYG